MQRIGRWEMACNLADGARIGRLRYHGVDLLTGEPAGFRPPQSNFGHYETRPVYGYDDCFPTVEACGSWPDHGEVCWRPWSGAPTECTVASALAPLRLTRRLAFEGARLRWSFAVDNDGPAPFPVQHVMHALMPMHEIDAIELPSGQGCDARQIAADLLALPSGNVRMLYQKGLTNGVVRLGFLGGLWLTMRFPSDIFPTLGIWWNNRGYPNEHGLHRSECAFEPTPGQDSMLAHGTTMTVPAQGQLAWQIDWEIERR
jgi:hypothetical protein